MAPSSSSGASDGRRHPTLPIRAPNKWMLLLLLLLPSCCLKAGGRWKAGLACGRETAAGTDGKSKPEKPGAASGAGPRFRKAQLARRHAGRAPMSGRRAQARGSSADVRQERAGADARVERRAADRDPRPAVISRTAGPAQVILARDRRARVGRPGGETQFWPGLQASPYHKEVP